MNIKHTPVLLKEIIQNLNLSGENKIFVDATLGLGGHAEEILKTISKSSILIGIDCDEESLALAKHRLKKYKNFIAVNDNFRNIDDVLKALNVKKIHGILFDLGVSTLHFEKKDRGFSFNKDYFLDMRLDKKQKLTAYDIINKYSLKDLEKIFREYGEEKFYKKIAREIIKKRPIKTTKELADIITNIKKEKKKIHPATKVFQALRIVVNDELNALKESLMKTVDLLYEKGRICVISFHSLEDRIVKNFFIQESKSFITENKYIPEERKEPKLKILTKKPIVPDEEEQIKNPKCRSAKLRVAEKI